jgi:hypothetical protein
VTSSEFTVLRTASALLIAAAAILAPAAIGVTSGTAVQFTADPPDQQPGDPADECDKSSKPGDASVACKPEHVGPQGAPSETDLTDSNSGIDYSPKAPPEK